MIKTTCRICSSPMRDVLDLGEFVPSDFVHAGQQDLPRVPLTLAECERCRLVQLRHTLDRDVLYLNYWYQSGLNSSMVASLQDIVNGVEDRIHLAPGDCVIDVGANDGTLLSLYKSPVYKVGFDPAKNLAAEATKKCDMFVSDFFETSEQVVPRAKVLTSIAMFYDLDDPRRFVGRVRDVLHPEGIWVVQMTDLVRMLRANAFDNICHEHLCYYSLAVLSDLVESCGMRVFDVEFNDVNGGSMRAYISRTGVRVPHSSVERAILDEANYLTDDALSSFSSRVGGAKRIICDFVRKERAAGKTFHALGASTKGNTLLQYFGLGGSEIECAAEVNPDKYGLVTAGSNVPIVSQEDSLMRRPDYYLVLPWHFIEHFLARRTDYLAAGGKLLTPLPEPTLYGSQGAERLN